MDFLSSLKMSEAGDLARLADEAGRGPVMKALMNMDEFKSLLVLGETSMMIELGLHEGIDLGSELPDSIKEKADIISDHVKLIIQLVIAATEP